jgi:4a-hydroxytetrahydrobiopterin dehydratase
MERMSEVQVREALAAHPEWSESAGAVHRTYQFPDFVAAMRFVNAVAQIAEADQHHPDILIRWNKVTLSLSTHDAGGITDKDFALAAKVDALCSSINGDRGARPKPAKPPKQ